MRKHDHHHCSGPGAQCDICGPDPRDVEIAALKKYIALLMAQRAGWEGDGSSPWERGERPLDQCADCGTIGLHECQGVPGGFGDDEDKP